MSLPAKTWVAPAVKVLLPSNRESAGTPFGNRIATARVARTGDSTPSRSLLPLLKPTSIQPPTPKVDAAWTPQRINTLVVKPAIKQTAAFNFYVG